LTSNYPTGKTNPFHLSAQSAKVIIGLKKANKYSVGYVPQKTN